MKKLMGQAESNHYALCGNLVLLRMVLVQASCLIPNLPVTTMSVRWHESQSGCPTYFQPSLRGSRVCVHSHSTLCGFLGFPFFGS